MEQSTLIKLRQAEATNVVSNGSYNVALRENVLLEEGDVVKIHSIFLDTTSESRIEIFQDTEITMTIAKFLLNTKAESTVLAANAEYRSTPNYAAGPPVVGVPMPDLRKYWVTQALPTGANAYNAEKVRLEIAVEVLPFLTWGDTTLTFQITQVGTGKKINITRHVPKIEADKNKHYDLIINVFMEGPTSIELLAEKSQLGKANMKRPTIGNYTITGPIVGADNHSSLWTEDLTFTINAGRYMPSEIAQIITDKMSRIDINGPIGNNYANDLFMTNTPCLSSVAQQNYLITGTTPPGKMYMNPEVNTEFPIASTVLLFNGSTAAANKIVAPADDLFIGASQTSLNYDDNLKKLNFDIIHFPYLVGTGTDFKPGVLYSGTNPVNNNAVPAVALPVIPLSSYSGIAFANLQPQAFWSELGFDDLAIEWQQQATPITLQDTSVLYPILITSQESVNTTGTFLGLDLPVAKTADFAIPTIPALGVQDPLTTPIISAREFDQVVDDEGYLLVQIGPNFQQKMVGGTTSDANGGFSQSGSNRVQSIIGKYFTTGSFLQDSGGGSVTYEHMGTPQLLSSLDVSVVRPDGSQPSLTELGSTNSIFVEIIKTIPVPPTQN